MNRTYFGFFGSQGMHGVGASPPKERLKPLSPTGLKNAEAWTCTKPKLVYPEGSTYQNS